MPSHGQFFPRILNLRLLALGAGTALWLAQFAVAASAGPGKARAPRRHAVSAANTAPKSSDSAASSSKHRWRRRRLRGQKAPTADRVKEIQSALSRDGFYGGNPTGKWDANTKDAVRRFQDARGLTATGKLDAPTLQKLGLGSDIAGVAAPRPAAPQTTAADPHPPGR